MEDVYKMEDLFPTHVLDSINVDDLWETRLFEEARSLLQNLEMTAWVSKELQIVLMDKTSKENAKKLLLIAWMQKFYNLKGSKLNDKRLSQKHMADASNVLLDHLFTLFVQKRPTQTGFTFFLDDKNKDKLLAYIVAMCLTLSNYKLDTHSFSSDMCITKRKLQSVAGELGCKVLKTDIVLSLPLRFAKRSIY